MSEAVEPNEFERRVLEGTSHSRTIVLTAQDGAELEDVEMSVVSKNELTKAIESMPSEVFEGVEDDAEDISAEEAEEIAKQSGGATVTEDMYEAFDRLCKESLSHKSYTDVQFGLIIDEFAFEMVFEIGSEILSFSLENSGNVTGFREQT